MWEGFSRIGGWVATLLAGISGGTIDNPRYQVHYREVVPRVHEQQSSCKTDYELEYISPKNKCPLCHKQKSSPASLERHLLMRHDIQK